jgi:hypothetical protein
MTGRYRHRKIGIYRRVAIAVSGYVGRANEGLSLAITEWVALRVIKKFYSEGCTRHAIQAPLNVRVTSTTNN